MASTVPSIPPLVYEVCLAKDDDGGDRTMGDGLQVGLDLGSGTSPRDRQESKLRCVQAGARTQA